MTGNSVSVGGGAMCANCVELDELATEAISEARAAREALEMVGAVIQLPRLLPLDVEAILLEIMHTCGIASAGCLVDASKGMLTLAEVEVFSQRFVLAGLAERALDGSLLLTTRGQVRAEKVRAEILLFYQAVPDVV